MRLLKSADTIALHILYQHLKNFMGLHHLIIQGEQIKSSKDE